MFIVNRRKVNNFYLSTYLIWLRGIFFASLWTSLNRNVSPFKSGSNSQANLSLSYNWMPIYRFFLTSYHNLTILFLNLLTNRTSRNDGNFQLTDLKKSNFDFSYQQHTLFIYLNSFHQILSKMRNWKFDLHIFYWLKWVWN